MLIIRGRVQGVGFRWAAREYAERFGLQGYAKNRSDGSVEIVAEGTSAALQEFTTWCYSGPRGAEVSLVEILPPPTAEPLNAFRIL